MRTPVLPLTILLLTLLVPAAPTAAQNDPLAEGEVVLRDGLIAPPVGEYGRNPIHIDPVEHALATDAWTRPERDARVLPDEPNVRWRAIEADEKGWFLDQRLRGGYLFFSVPSARERIVILHVSGHSNLTVNGTPRAADPYRYNFVRLPVRLQAGDNDILVRVGRGRFRGRIIPVNAEVDIIGADVTRPDAVVGEPTDAWAAAPIVNLTDAWRRDLIIRYDVGETPGPATPLDLPPLSVTKSPFRITSPAPAETGEMEGVIRVIRPDGEVLAAAPMTLRTRAPQGARRVTFRSAIDGSIQYYGLRVAAPSDDPEAAPPGLLLSLHGAGVEGIGQARTYQPKDWLHHVAPTNRRKFGFDWEDWGRWDAIEVLEHARARLDHDPRRNYLSGHSMGGHGTWHLGTTFPDQFAAVGPSAGWISFWSYTGAARYDDPSNVEGLLARAVSASDTLAQKSNLAQLGVYVLHGDADDNVPVGQARQMRSVLAGFHPDFAYYERPGAGHWWGNRCCDWPPMMDFFRAHERPEDVTRVTFTTAAPSVSASSDWVRIEQQVEAMRPSAVDLSFDSDANTVRGTTSNVRRFSIDAARFVGDTPSVVEVDGQSVPVSVTARGRAWLVRDEGGVWTIVGPTPASEKRPERSGPFKDAFRNNAVFVYGTQGDAEENAWAYAKARYDAETFWYRGNGSFDLLPDIEFDAATHADRNVILYGHADMNAAWDAVLDDTFRLTRGGAALGSRTWTGDDLAALVIRPRKDSDLAAVGVVAGSGLTGMRATNRMPYFVSGIAYPDVFLSRASMWRDGTAAVECVGFFGNGWDVEGGVFAPE